MFVVEQHDFSRHVSLMVRTCVSVNTFWSEGKLHILLDTAGFI